MAQTPQPLLKKNKKPVGRLGNGSPFFFMTTRRILPSRRLFVVVLIFALAACSPAATPTPFRPPTMESPLIEPTLIIQPTKPVVVVQSSPLPTILPTTNPQECISDLNFVSDVTLPDNTFVTYGASMDKQWLVENTGTCPWDASYRLRHLGGAILGAPEEVMLYPAKAGTQATIQIVFTAPFTDGVYESAWQAFDPQGNPFGDPIYIRVTVATP
jgi:hypothetical protein